MARRLPSLTALRAFEAAARHESFTRAAAELNVTHVAISRQVQRLEEWLGFALFVRLNRRVRLTVAGEEYLPVLRDAFDAVHAATGRLRERHATGATASRRLRLTVDPGFASRWLLPHMASFHALCPDIEVEVLPQLALPDFSQARIDAAIYYHYGGTAWQRPAPHVAIQSVALLRLRAFPVCLPALAAGPPPCNEPADLRHHRLLHERDTGWWRRWLEAAGAGTVDWRRGAIYHDSNLALEAALAGEGIAIGDNLLAFAELEDGRLVKPFELSVPTGEYHLVWREVGEPPPRLSAFREWLQAQCEHQQQGTDRW